MKNSTTEDPRLDSSVHSASSYSSKRQLHKQLNQSQDRQKDYD